MGDLPLKLYAAIIMVMAEDLAKKSFQERKEAWRTGHQIEQTTVLQYSWSHIPWGFQTRAGLAQSPLHFSGQ